MEFGCGQDDDVTALVDADAGADAREDPQRPSGHPPNGHHPERRVTDCLFCRIARREIPAKIVV